MMKHTLTAAALAVVLATPAFAQTGAPSAPAQSSSSTMPPASTTSSGGASFL